MDIQQLQFNFEPNPLDVIYPRGGNMNFRTYYNKVGTSGFPGRTILDLLPGRDYIKQAGDMINKNWSPVIKKGQELLGKTSAIGKAAPVLAKVGTGITLAGAPIVALNNSAMARQMEKENRINPYLHTNEAIANRRARNANIARWAGLGGALGLLGGPGAMAGQAALLLGASQIGEGIADKFSKRKSVVNSVGTYSPLYLTDEQLQRVLMTQAERDANPRGGVKTDKTADNKSTTAPKKLPSDLEEIDAKFFSDPKDFPYKTSWMGNPPNNSGNNNSVPYNNNNTSAGNDTTGSEATDTPQEVLSDENGNPVLTGAIDNGTPGFDFSNLRNYMTPGELAYQDYLNNSPLLDVDKLQDMIANENRRQYNTALAMRAFGNPRIERVGGAFTIRSNDPSVQLPTPPSEFRNLLQTQKIMGDILKTRAEMEGTALQRQGAEQVARQLNLPPALLTNPDLAKQALADYGNLQRVGLQESNRYSIAKMSNATKKELGRDINILNMNKLYSDRQIAQAKLRTQEKLARITGDARYATALVNLATNAMEPQQQAQAQFILNQILKDAGYDTNYTTSSDVETNDNLGYGNRIPGDTL